MDEAMSMAKLIEAALKAVQSWPKPEQHDGRLSELHTLLKQMEALNKKKG